jgi:multidrug resistance protein
MASPDNRRQLGVLFLTVFVDLLGFGIVIPLLPLYAKSFAAKPDTVGMLLASYSAAQFVFAPVWGALSDRIGRRPVLMVSIFGSLVAYVLYANAHSLTTLFLARSFAGLCGANLSTAQAYIADVTTAKDRAKGMALIGAAFGIGFVLGPAIAGVVSKHFGVRAPFWVAGVIALANFLSAALFLPEPARVVARQAVRRSRLVALGDAFRVPQLGPLLVLFFLFTFAFANLEGTFALWLAEPPFRYHEAGVGYVFTYIGVIATVIQGAATGRLANRFGEPKLIVAGTCLLSLGMFLLPTATSLPLLLLVILPITTGHSVSNPANTALISRLSPADRQGEILGVAQSISSLGRILGPWFGGAAFRHYGKNAPYWAGGLVMACAFVLAIARVSGLAPAEGQGNQRAQ